MGWRTLLWIGVAAAIALFAATMLWRLAQSVRLAKQSTAYQQPLAAPAQRMLIVGDSTAVGTGASHPSRSIAGLIGQQHPRLHIDNRARDGATFDALLPQLEGGSHFDLVLIQAGGNDVIRLRDMDRVRDDVARVLLRAKQMADQVLIMPAGNIGNASFFMPPLSWWMSSRARELHSHVEAQARRIGAVYVDLYEPADSDPFVQRGGMQAADGLHPNDAGYALWLDELRRQADLPRRLAPSR